jgi:hypothetical protein
VIENKKSLMALAELTASIIRDIIDNDGELTGELEQRLNSTESDLAVKVDSYKYVLEDLEFESEKWATRAAQAAKLSSSIAVYRQSMRERIMLAMKKLGKEELNGDEFKFVLTKTPPSVEVIDGELIPQAYKKTKVEIQIDKKKIAEDLKAGYEVTGAKLNVGVRLAVKGVKKNE